MRRPRFLVIIGLIVLANFVLIALVLTALDRGDVRAVSTSPTDGATRVSTRPVLRVTFKQAVDLRSLQDQVHLEPAAPGSVRVDGADVLFTPTSALAPDT